MAFGKPIYTFNIQENSCLSQSGALMVSIGDLKPDFS
jgi:hypothetical protein